VLLGAALAWLAGSTASGQDLGVRPAKGEPPEPIITSYAVSESPTRFSRVAVLPFEETASAKGAAKVAQEAARKALRSRGFEPVGSEEEGRPSASRTEGEALEGAHRLGAGAVLLGRVDVFSEVEVKRPTALVRRRGVVAVVEAERRRESRVAVTLRILSAPQGALLFSSAGRYGSPFPGGAEAAAEALLAAMLGRWAEAPR
jgi:hypothetical protein